ncbi:MAG: hypothetical protein ACJ790_00825 [Myxococcaceae bacterium]
MLVLVLGGGAATAYLLSRPPELKPSPFASVVTPTGLITRSA